MPVAVKKIIFVFNKLFTEKGWIIANTWFGGVVLVVGLFVGTMAVSLFSTFWKVVFRENIELKDWFLMVANSVGFLTAIAFFDFFIV